MIRNVYSTIIALNATMSSVDEGGIADNKIDKWSKFNQHFNIHTLKHYPYMSRFQIGSKIS